MAVHLQVLALTSKTVNAQKAVGNGSGIPHHAGCQNTGAQGITANVLPVRAISLFCIT